MSAGGDAERRDRTDWTVEEDVGLKMGDRVGLYGFVCVFCWVQIVNTRVNATRIRPVSSEMPVATSHAVNAAMRCDPRGLAEQMELVCTESSCRNLAFDANAPNER